VRDDEFDRLRESLADLGLGTRPLGGRIEPSFEGAPGPVAGRLDDLAAASSWMEPALGRRANWPEPPEAPGLPPEREAAPADVSQPSWPVLDAADRPVPAWPPQTHSAPEPHLDEAEVPPAEPAAPAPTQPAEPEPAELPPAASDEGIVGAYQVGEAHFTIYADGSIQARTPDGDYSFASMDELKIYLASEKTRLGG
jgi:septal ring-binding cell division protein DamX